MTIDHSRYFPHVYRYDSAALGWRVFPAEPGVVKAYDHIHVKWDMNPTPNQWGQQYAIVYLSIDSGKTWNTGDGWYSVYNTTFGTYRAWNREHNQVDIKPILEDRANFMRARSRRLAKEKRDAFKALTATQQANDLKKRAADKEFRASMIQKRKEKTVSAVMNQLLEIGPQLVTMRDNIDNIIKLMANGNINQEFPYYPSTIRDIRYLNYKLGGRVVNHLKSCQKKAK